MMRIPLLRRIDVVDLVELIGSLVSSPRRGESLKFLKYHFTSPDMEELLREASTSLRAAAVMSNKKDNAIQRWMVVFKLVHNPAWDTLLTLSLASTTAWNPICDDLLALLPEFQ